MRLLVACLDQQDRLELRNDLLSRGFGVDVVETIDDVLWRMAAVSFDAVVLHCSQPPRELIGRIRASDLWPPVLAVLPTEQMSPALIAELLDRGIDDVLRAPYDDTELHARIRSLARRSPHPRPTLLRVGDLTLDPALQLVRRGTQVIDLQPRKFAILTEMMRHPGEILSRSYLIDRVLSGDYDGTSNVIDCYVSHLRTKVDKPFGRHTIKTVRAVGYRLDPRA